MRKGNHQLLSILSDANFHSGQSLANQLGLTRAAIWKSIKQFESMGLVFERKHGKGYRLLRPLELLSKDKLVDGLKQCQFNNLDVLTITESTNTNLYERSLLQSIHGDVIISEYQSLGRGRRGNTWVSPFAGGIYVSVGWQFDLSFESISLISLNMGVALIRTLQEFKINDARLKWPNDVMVENKKIGGILLDMRGEANGPVTVIIGIGLNYDIDNKYKKNIDQEYTDVCRNTEQNVSRNDLAISLLKNTFNILNMIDNNKTDELMQEWRLYDYFKGKNARLTFQDEIIEGKVKGVDDLGHLIMKVNGNIQRFSAGDLSLRSI